MSKKKDHPRRTAETRLASRVLEGLMASADDELGEFREWRVGKQSQLDLAALRRARELLDRIAAVIQSGDARAWKELDGAWRVLVEGADARRVAADLARAEMSPELRPAVPSPASHSGASAEAPAASGAELPSPEPPANLPEPPPLLGAPAPAVQASSPPRPLPVLANVPRADAARAASPWAVGQSPASQGPVPAALAPAFAAPTPAAPGVASPRPVAATAATIDIDETQGLDGRPLFLDVLPFKGEAAPPVPGAALADLPPLPAGDLDATGFMAAPILIEETLPFAGAFSLRKELASAAARPASGAGAPARPVEPPAVAQPSGAPVVSEASGAAVVELTVEQFASLCASCEVYREHATEIERRFGLVDAASRRALDAVWARRISTDGAVYRAFTARFHEYRSWLLAERAEGKVR